VLVSRSTASLVDGNLRDLGEHRFKDMVAAERVFQLGSEDHPPIRSLARTNLPIAAWPLVGRARELLELRRLISNGRRLVTLTGPGGSGKTRLALQAAAEVSEEFGAWLLRGSYVRGVYSTLANGQSESSQSLTARQSGVSRCAQLARTHESVQASRSLSGRG
jgi:hypothetical protein